MAACRCTGRSGKRKRLFRTAQQAEVIGRRDFKDGIFDVYPCPTKARRFHLSHVLEYRKHNDHDSRQEIAFWESADRLGQSSHFGQHRNPEHDQGPEGQ